MHFKSIAMEGKFFNISLSLVTRLQLRTSAKATYSQSQAVHLDVFTFSITFKEFTEYSEFTNCSSALNITSNAPSYVMSFFL